MLKYLRNQNKNLCSVEQLAKKAKVGVTEIEEALLSGEIKPIRECLYAGDDLEITIDLSNKSLMSHETLCVLFSKTSTADTTFIYNIC